MTDFNLHFIDRENLTLIGFIYLDQNFHPSTLLEILSYKVSIHQHKTNQYLSPQTV